MSDLGFAQIHVKNPLVDATMYLSDGTPDRPHAPVLLGQLTAAREDNVGHMKGAVIGMIESNFLALQRAAGHRRATNWVAFIGNLQCRCGRAASDAATSACRTVLFQEGQGFQAIMKIYMVPSCNREDCRIYSSSAMYAVENMVERTGDGTFMQRCSSCSAMLVRPMVCTACRQVAYCNRDCQRQDWPRHRGSCRRIDRTFEPGRLFL